MFIVNHKYVLTKDLGEDLWQKKGTIVTCTKVDPIVFFTYPAASLDYHSGFTLNEEESLITIQEYYEKFEYHTEESHKSIKFRSGNDKILIAITSKKRSSESIQVSYMYYITVNEAIKVVGEGYSGNDNMPTFEDIIKLYKND